MGYRLAAALVVAVHLAYVVFVVAGGFLAWRWPSLVRLHLPAVAVSAALALSGRECPLSDLEKGLRRLAGDEPYPGGFVNHYLVEPLYAGGTTPPVRLGLRLLVVGIVATAYVGLLRLRHHARRPAA